MRGVLQAGETQVCGGRLGRGGWRRDEAVGVIRCVGCGHQCGMLWGQPGSCMARGGFSTSPNSPYSPLCSRSRQPEPHPSAEQQHRHQELDSPEPGAERGPSAEHPEGCAGEAESFSGQPRAQICLRLSPVPHHHIRSVCCVIFNFSVCQTCIIVPPA